MKSENRDYVLKSSGEETSKARAKMEEFIGHELPQDQVVHHKDEDPSNDSLENLQIVTRSEHVRMHNTKDIPIDDFRERIVRKMASRTEPSQYHLIAEGAGIPEEWVHKLAPSQ